MTAAPFIDLTGRVAFVSGAAGGGIGTSTAAVLSRLGARVYVNGRSESSVRATCEKLRGGGAEVAAAVLDVTDGGTLTRFTGEFGPPDIVVHNAAGNWRHMPPWAVDDADWDSTFDTIVNGARNLIGAFVPNMVRERYGKLVFVSSGAAMRGTLGRSYAYAGAKSALHGMCVQLALELAPLGVSVNVVAPSQIDTPRIRSGGRKTEESLANLASALPIGRIGTAGEIANLVAFLASDACNYLVGQVIAVDGGASLALGRTAALK